MKQIFLLGICLVLLISIAQAAELDITAKTPLGAGAVAIFEIVSNVELLQDLTIQQIVFKNNNSERISTQITIEKQENSTYLLGTNLPKDLQERVTINIENVQYMNNNQLQQTTIVQDFPLQETAKLHISPPIITLEIEAYQNPTITLQVTNKESNTTTIQPQSTFEVLTPNIEIQSEATEFIQVKAHISESNATEIEGSVTIGAIIIPIHILRYGVAQTPREETPAPEIVQVPIAEEPTIIFTEEAKELNRILKQDQVLEGPLRIKNTAVTRIEGLQLKLTNGLGEIVSVKLEKAGLDPQETTEIVVSINERKMLLKEYEGELQILKEEKVLATFPIRIRPSTGATTAPSTQQQPEEEPTRTALEEENRSPVPITILVLLIAAAATLWYIKSRPQEQKYQGFKPRR